MCKKVLEFENKWSNEEVDHKPQYKKYLDEYFPYDEDEIDA